MNAQEFTSRKELYQYHLEEFKKYSGSASKYCIENNLDPSKFSYYKGYKKQPSQKAAAFVSVNVKPSEAVQSTSTIKSNKVIDPEWLAVFHHFPSKGGKSVN